MTLTILFLSIKLIAIIIEYFLIKTIIIENDLHWEKGLKLITIILSVTLGWRGLIALFLVGMLLSFSHPTKGLDSVRKWVNKRAKW